MKIKKETGVVGKVEQGYAEVYITFPHKQHGTGKCAGCGLCASRPDGRTYTIPVPQEKELKAGDVVTVEIAEFPFAGSICMVFILPIILMVLLPVMSTVLGKRMDIPMLCKGWFVIIAGVLGFFGAFAVNFLVNRWFRKKYPLRIENEENGDD